MPHDTPLISTIVGGFVLAFQIIEHARHLNPQIEVVARAHSSAEVLHLEKHGATHTNIGEREIAEDRANLVSSSPQNSQAG